MSMQAVDRMGDKGPGEEPDDHGACQHESDVLRL
jgi:hypothetical protein